MGDSLEGVDAPPEDQSVSIVELSEFCNYIRKSVTLLLQEDDVTPVALNTALEDKNNQDCIKKFLSDSQVSTLFVQRSSSKG